ncbi:MAG: hypothetical protein JWP36_1711 [Paucimonas sp.]|nr:hypothetical protein [Paucimonas sp.]
MQPVTTNLNATATSTTTTTPTLTPTATNNWPYASPPPAPVVSTRVQEQPHWQTAFEGRSQDDYFQPVLQEVLRNCAQFYLDMTTTRSPGVKVAGVELDPDTGWPTHIAVFRKGRNDQVKSIVVPASEKEVHPGWAGKRAKAAWGDKTAALNCYINLVRGVAKENADVVRLYYPEIGTDLPGNHARRAFDALAFASKILPSFNPEFPDRFPADSAPWLTPKQESAFFQAYRTDTVEALYSSADDDFKSRFVPRLLLCAIEGMGLFMTDKAGSEERWHFVVGDENRKRSSVTRTYPQYARDQLARFVGELRQIIDAAAKVNAGADPMPALRSPESAMLLLGFNPERMIREHIVHKGDSSGEFLKACRDRVKAARDVLTAQLFNMTDRFLATGEFAPQPKQ